MGVRNREGEALNLVWLWSLSYIIRVCWNSNVILYWDMIRYKGNAAIREQQMENGNPNSAIRRRCEERNKQSHNLMMTMKLFSSTLTIFTGKTTIKVLLISHIIKETNQKFIHTYVYYVITLKFIGSTIWFTLLYKSFITYSCIPLY